MHRLPLADEPADLFGERCRPFDDERFLVFSFPVLFGDYGERGYLSVIARREPGVSADCLRRGILDQRFDFRGVLQAFLFEPLDGVVNGPAQVALRGELRYPGIEGGAGQLPSFLRRLLRLAQRREFLIAFGERSGALVDERGQSLRLCACAVELPG